MARTIAFERLAPLILLAIMAAFLLYAAWHDSATMDEAAHIPAGYSYVLKKDMRLNPEHPPLVKTLAGIPILLLKGVNFPENHPGWQTGINDQWGFGFDFLYRSGNDAEKIVHASRIPAIILTLILGWFIWLWGKDILGPKWGLLPLALYTFSPNFVAHGHLVTTDIGATLGIIISLYYFSKYLKFPTFRNIVCAGIALGIGLLLKFTVALVVPVIILTGLLFGMRLRKLAAIGGIAAVVILLVYLFHVWNYPVERQIGDADFILTSYGFRPAVNFIIWLMDKPILRAWGQYLFGFLMNLQRAAGGHTTYFLGEISASGRWYYFPLVYLIKEPIPILILLAIALFYALRGLTDLHFNGRMRRSILDHVDEVGMLIFIIGFWASSISSNLNIGIRHIFPTLPLIYLLASKQIKSWGNASKPKLFFIGALFLWLVAEFIFINPNFLSYFNEFIGGPPNAAWYVVDSNLDWGQDLKRLRDFVIKNNIRKIKVDYFGGGDAAYYLGDRYQPLPRGPQKGWIAISVSFLQGGRGRFAAGHQGEEGFYRWLDQYEPVAKIGYSIYVYHIQ